MRTRQRQLRVATLAVIGVYALTPFVAGLFKTYDPRGPKIFAESHHELLYSLVYYLAGDHHHDGKPRGPFMQERTWFYGIEGETIPSWS